MSDAPSNNTIQEYLRRYWWLVVLILAILGLICVVIGPGQFLIRPAAPEETPGTILTLPPTEEPTTVVPSDTPTNTPTDTPTKERPTDKPTDKPTRKPPDNPPPSDEPTDTSCVVNPDDGVCDLRCENTDLDSNNCVCNMDNVCGVGEGFNCPDCSFGQCDNPCKTDADCHNPSLTCNGGFCGGSTCPAPPPPEPVDCSIKPYNSNVQCLNYPACKIICSDGSKLFQADCSNLCG
jgi:hypothetical protein